MKQERHSAIRQILDRTSIANQDHLRQALAAQGHHVTQATLSRDVRELRLSKGPGGYVIASNGAGDDDEGPGIREVMKGFGLEVRQALNQLVVITVTGGAQPIAAGVDYEDWPEVIGTIAGDDTVLIICPDDKQARIIKKRIESYLG